MYHLGILLLIICSSRCALVNNKNIYNQYSLAFFLIIQKNQIIEKLRFSYTKHVIVITGNRINYKLIFWIIIDKNISQKNIYIFSYILAYKYLFICYNLNSRIFCHPISTYALIWWLHTINVLNEIILFIFYSISLNKLICFNKS